MIRYILDELQVEPTGVSVRSRYRPAGHVSHSRQVRYSEGAAIGHPAAKRRPKGRGKGEDDRGGRGGAVPPGLRQQSSGSGWWNQGSADNDR